MERNPELLSGGSLRNNPLPAKWRTNSVTEEVSSSEDNRISAEFHDEVAGPEPWPKESRARAIRKKCQQISGEEELSGHQHTQMKMGT